MSKKLGFTFLLWNKKYGDDSKFIVRDNSNQKQSFFTPEKMGDMVWTDKDLTKDPELKDWDTFGDETIDDLEDVIF